VERHPTTADADFADTHVVGQPGPNNEGPSHLIRKFVAVLGQAAAITAVLTVLTGLAFPLVTGALAQVLFPRTANGSLVRAPDGTIEGSALIGQQFTRPEYFHPRPSAAGDQGYDATSSGGTNLGPTNAKLVNATVTNAKAYRQENGLGNEVPLPADAVTASGSGLDPDISPANALLQAPRVARARGVAPATVVGLVQSHVVGRDLGILGEPRVNVLELNLALDQLTPQQPKSGGG
jgi:K+-transporting ATPase ATPase C chain